MQNSSRLQQLIDVHSNLFKSKPDAIFSTSGRTELGGNHTDHNLGKVICASINLDTLAAVSNTHNSTVCLFSEGYKPINIDINDLSVHEEERETSASIIRGVAASIVKRGGKVGGFNANVTSSVLPGSGLSSSASFEDMIGTIFNDLFNNGKFSTTEIAIMAREAENNYFGKPCGLMDQIGCANGGVVAIDFKDFENPKIENVSVDFKKFGYDLLIVDSRANHENLTQDYAAIPSEMKSVAQCFGKQYLREVSPEEFEKNIDKIKDKVCPRAILRAKHFYSENVRVENMLKALKEQNINEYLKLVNESGRSSEQYLQNIVSAVHPENNALQKALDTAKELLGDEGAYRVHGGGFAGTIQLYSPLKKTSQIIEKFEQLFGKDCCIIISVRNNPTCRIQ